MDYKVYLDNCCFNRPFDDQSQIRVRLETEAKLFIQHKIKANELYLVWSYILDYENSENPFQIRQLAIAKWKHSSTIVVSESDEILSLANRLSKKSFKAKDSLHIACAIQGDSDYFLTTDDKILNKKSLIQDVDIINPMDFIKVLEE